MLDPGGGGAPKRKGKRKPKPAPTPSVNATLGAQGQAETERQSRRARRRPQRPSEPTTTVNATVGASGQRDTEREAKKARKRAKARRETAKVERVLRRGTRRVEYVPNPPEEKGLFDTLTDKAEDIARHGVVGEFDREAASTGRSLLTGSKNPNVGQLALAAAPVPAAKGARAIQKVISAAKGIRTGERAAKATKAAEEVASATKKARPGQRVSKARQAAKTEKAKTGAVSAKTQRKVRDREIAAGTRKGKVSKRGKAGEVASKAGTAAKVRYGKAGRKARRAKRAHNIVNSPVPVGLAAGAAMPGEVGERTRAFVEGTVTADPIKSAETTAKAIPGVFAFGATTAGAAFQAAKHGDPGYLKGPVKEAGRAFEALEPLVSGDPDAVREATEEQVGYVLAPLAPRGAISRPARATGKAAKATAKATGRGAKVVARPAAKKLKREPQGAPGRMQRAGQVVTGGKQRKAVALESSRAIDPRHHHAVREAEDIVVTGRHAKGARGLKNPTGPEAVQAAGVLARYGITRKTKKAGTVRDRMKDIRRSFAEGPMTKGEAEATNVRNTMDFLEKNPKVLDDPRFWDTVDQWRDKTRPLQTSDIATFGAQRRVAEKTSGKEILMPWERITPEARLRSGKKSRVDAWKVRDEQVKAAKKAAADARKTRAQIKEAQATAKRQSKRGSYRIERAEIAPDQIKKGDTVKIGGQYRKVKAVKTSGSGVTEISYVRNGKTTSRRYLRDAAPVAYKRRIDESARAREEAKARVQELKELEGQQRREFQRLSTNARALHRELDPFTRPGVDPSVHVRRPPENRQMVREFVDETRAARGEDLDDPIWLSEPDPGFKVEGGHGGPAMPTTGARAQHRWTGRAEAMDKPDRSLEALLTNTLIRPHTQRGIHKFINRVNRMGVEVQVKGRRRRVVTDREWNDLVARGDIDPTKFVPVPSRHWGQALKGEAFDLSGEINTAINRRLEQDLRKLDGEKGVKNVILPREIAEELAAQLNPKRSGLEATVQTIGAAGARVVLFSPAWVAAQFVNEGSQAVAAVGARGFAGGAVDLFNLWRTDKQAYRDLIHASGPVSPSATPVPHKLTLTTDEYRRFANTVRIVRKTTVGRFLHDAATLRTFGNIDRWKGTRIRSIALLAKSNRQFGKFSKGLAGSLKEMERLSDKLGKMSRAERQQYVAKNINTREFEPMLDYLDDVMGNWRAFTRLERQAGPLIAFYPYVRMSLRWTFWTFPKNHPIKAQILYFLSQQNRDELSKLMGREPDFLESMLPVWLDKEGEPNAVMPGGRRFGAPGMNTMVEALGEGNISRLPNTLNPVLTSLYRGFSGTDPFTGEQIIDPKDPKEVMMHLGNQFLSMTLPARVTGANRLGKEESDLKQVFDNLDPNRAFRSAANPFIPQSAERFRMQTILSDALDDVSDKPEYGDLVDAFMAGDPAEIRKLAKKVDLAKRAQKIIEEFLPPTKKAKAAVSDAGAVYYGGSKALKETSGSGGSAAKALQNKQFSSSGAPQSAADALSGSTSSSPSRRPRSAADALAQLP